MTTLRKRRSYRRGRPPGERLRPELMPQIARRLRELFEKQGEVSPTDATKIIRRQEVERIEQAMGPLWTFEMGLVITRAVNYRSIVRWFYLLRQLGMIEYSRSEPARGIPKNFYTLVPGSEPLWTQRGLYNALYPSAYWGGRRYRSKMRAGLVETGRDAPKLGRWTKTALAEEVEKGQERRIKVPPPPPGLIRRA